MKKIYIVMTDNKNVRSISTTDIIHVGSIIENENWLGKQIKGGKVIKVFR